MKTLEQLLQERSSIITEVQKQAHAALATYCAGRGFLLVNRTKDFASIQDKMETGRYKSFSALDDLVAFSVIIDTLGQESEVRRFLRKAFRVHSIRSGGTLQDERAFDFDCTRIYCRLTDDARLYDHQVREMLFEVQIRTLLQHAWSKITHPHVYKSRTYDAKAGRLAAELMAQLEATDRSFARFRTSSKSVKQVIRRDVQRASEITEMIDGLVSAGVIPSELRPQNGRRLGENIYQSIRDRAKNFDRAKTTIEAFLTAQRETFPMSVTLFQLAAVALHNAEILDRGSAGRPRQYYVTDELISLFPAAQTIPNRVTMD